MWDNSKLFVLFYTSCFLLSSLVSAFQNFQTPEERFWIPIPWITVPTTTTQAAATTAAPVTPVNLDTTLWRAIYEAHQNTIRALHSAPPCVQNDTLAALANDCVQELAELPATPDPGLTWNCSQYPLGALHGRAPSTDFPNGTALATAVQTSWYTNGFMDYATNDAQPNDINHFFTQMVWISSTQYGCAVLRNDTAQTISVSCLYSPAGNVMGQYPANVKLPSDF